MNLKSNIIYLITISLLISHCSLDTKTGLWTNSEKIKLENDNLEILPGSLLEASIKYNVRNSLSIPDTSIMLEGNKVFVYTVSKENIANKTQIKIGIRHNGNVEVISGLNNGDSIVAEGLKKVRPRGKIKPIKR